jgi:carbonic anhydrase
MNSLDGLFTNNRAWAKRITERDPSFFQALAAQQSPSYLWIGCADSRVPANEIVGLMPGELFVHRNVANVVVHTDLNCLSVVQYAVDVLTVGHVIVCGHYGCGGIRCAMESKQHGLIDNWLRHVKDIYDLHKRQLNLITDPEKREARLVELNVLHQVYNVARTTIVQNAWSRGKKLAIHGWAYRIEDGIVHDLGFRVSSPGEIGTIYKMVEPSAE